MMLQLLLALLLLPAPEDPRCTVALRKGDVVEGVFRSATAADLTLLVAGQELRIPVVDIRYVSFVGRLDATADSTKASSARGTMQDAFAALDDLRETLRIGVLRDQYSAKLVDTLPRVNAFIDSSKDWTDVRLSLAAAVQEFKGPLGRISTYNNPWTRASLFFHRAGLFVDYAKALAAQPNEQTRKEDPAERQLTLGEFTQGRLGHGDEVASDMLAKGEFNGCLADVLVLRVDRPGQLVVQAAGVQPGLHLALLGPGGVPLGHTRSGDKEWKRDLRMSGEYRLWVLGALGEVGIYGVKVTVQ